MRGKSTAYGTGFCTVQNACGSARLCVCVCVRRDWMYFIARKKLYEFDIYCDFSGFFSSTISFAAAAAASSFRSFVISFFMHIKGTFCCLLIYFFRLLARSIVRSCVRFGRRFVKWRQQKRRWQFSRWPRASSPFSLSLRVYARHDERRSICRYEY